MKQSPPVAGPNDPIRRPRHPGGREAVALLALLTFGCTVVRAPASTLSPRIPVHGGIAEPQLELWLESGEPVGQQEARSAGAGARAALEGALASRRLEEGEQLLVVRAQGVSRTASRRSNQNAAIAGMIIGVVVVVVAAILASKSSGKRGGHPAARGSPRPAGPRVAGAVPRPPRAGPRVPVWPRGHRHHAYDPGPSIGFHVGLALAFPGPVPAPPPEPAWQGAPMALPPPPPPAPAPAVEQAAADPAELAELLPPPLLPLDLESRGFFSGDAVRVELLLVDRQTGEPLWVKTVEEESDPRDPEAMKALLDGALDAQEGWIPATAPRP